VQPPELFTYTSLDTSNSQLNVQYAAELYKQAIEKLLSYHKKLQRSRATHVVKLDTGYKVVATGMTTAMAADGLILATWLGISSLWELCGPLTALSMRCSHLGKVGHMPAR
jgi:hypothetical protein